MCFTEVCQFISSNIPSSPAYGVCIQQLIHYSRTCAQHSDFLDRAHLLWQKSLQIVYGRHYSLIECYKIIHISNDNGYCPLCIICLSAITAQDIGINSIYGWVT